MEGEKYVLASKNDECLFVKLTYSRRKGKIRAQWEFTDDLEAATTFASATQVDWCYIDHGLPCSMVRLRPYENAFSDWLARSKPL